MWTPAETLSVIGAAVTLIGTIGSVTISVIAAMRSTEARTRSEEQSARTDALSKTVADVHTLATQTARDLVPPESLPTVLTGIVAGAVAPQLAAVVTAPLQQAFGGSAAPVAAPDPAAPAASAIAAEQSETHDVPGI